MHSLQVKNFDLRVIRKLTPGHKNNGRWSREMSLSGLGSKACVLRHPVQCSTSCMGSPPMGREAKRLGFSLSHVFSPVVGMANHLVYLY